MYRKPMPTPPPMTQPNVDLDPNETFAAVGRAITQWEILEALLSILYSIFEGKRNQLDAMQEYGKKGRIFFDRLKLLETAAERFFQSHPSQSHEGMFCEVVREARALSTRRHQVAHGIVQGILTYLPENNDPERGIAPVPSFAVVPPWYAFHQLTKTHGFYRYGSAEIDEWGSEFSTCAAKARELASCLSAV